MTDDPVDPTDGPLDPTDEVASAALDEDEDTRGVDELPPGVRARMAQMNEVRTLLADEGDAPQDAALDSLLADALRISDEPSIPPRRTRRPPAWIGVAAAILIVVLGISVFAMTNTQQAGEAARATVDSDAGAADGPASSESLDTRSSSALGDNSTGGAAEVPATGATGTAESSPGRFAGLRLHGSARMR